MIGVARIGVVAGVMVLCLTACGESRNSVSSEITSAISQPAEVSTEYFKSDKGLNHFFQKYNEIAEYPFEEEQIQQGNVKAKALISTGDFYIEMVNSRNGLEILIDDGPEESVALYPVFRDFLKVMDDSLSDEQIKQAWSDIKKIGTKYMYDGNYTLNSLKMNYSNVEFQGSRQVKVHIYGLQYSA